MVMCWAPDCKHYGEQKNCRFFRFPRDEKTRNKWIKLLRRPDLPTPHSLICSCHFKDGKKENLPRIFLHNEGKIFDFPEVHRQRSRSNTRSESVELPTDGESNRDSTLDSTLSSRSPGAASVMPISSPPEQLQPNVCCLSCTAISAENYFLTKEVAELTEKAKQIKLQPFTIDAISHKDELVKMYTGIPDIVNFNAVLDLFSNMELNYYAGWSVERISKADQLLMTLMKLRLNSQYEDLACRFNCSTATVSNVFLTWLHALHEVLFVDFMCQIPSMGKNRSCLPVAFSHFSSCRIILDCTEGSVDVPHEMHKQQATYSNYKHKNTFKALIGVAPNGVITYVSKLFPGSTSDKKIVQYSKDLLEQLRPGDLVLADKGFLIQEDLPAGVNLNIPPFLIGGQFTRSQVQATESIARARIHVERAICRIKNFSILSHIPATLLPNATLIFQVCAAVVNLQFPLIQEVEPLFA